LNLLKILYDFGMAIDFQDSLMWSALHSAALNGSCKCLQLLIDYGANVQVLNSLYCIFLINDKFHDKREFTCLC
jgi:ankyrin repeat protein